IYNTYLGRLKDKLMWVEAFLKGRYVWGVRSFWILLAFLVTHRDGILNGIKTVLSTTKDSDDEVDSYALREAEKEKARVVVGGHNHRAKRFTDTERPITYVNCGTWSELLVLQFPEEEARERSSRWIARRWYAFLRHLYSAKTPLGKRFTSLVVHVMVLTATLVYVPFLIADRWPKAYSTMQVLNWTLWLGMGLISMVFVIAKVLTRFFYDHPEVIAKPLFTSALVRRYDDGALKADLMVYEPADKAIRELV
ncbi:MAG: hypothetical protein RLZZ324_175, partial [Candidatus Parcubacteria bacterium]